MITTLQARFISPLAGTVYFRQMDGRHASIWGKVYWVNDTNVTFDHNWHVHEFAVSYFTELVVKYRVIHY